MATGCSVCGSSVVEHFECKGSGDGVFGHFTCGTCMGTGQVCSNNKSHNWRTGQRQSPPPSEPMRTNSPPPKSNPSPPAPTVRTKPKPPTVQKPRSLAQRIGFLGWVILATLSLVILPFGAIFIDVLATSFFAQFGRWAVVSTALLAGVAGLALTYLWIRLRRKSRTSLWPMLFLYLAISLMCGAVMALLTPEHNTTPEEVYICYAIMLGALLVEWLVVRRRRKILA